MIENKIPMTEGIDVLAVLVDAATVAGWVGEGLPSDRTSTENGTITTTSERWPLCVTLSFRGSPGLRSANQKILCKLFAWAPPKTVDVVEKAIENGSTVLIENMAESIDAALMSVVTRSIVKKGRKMSIKMGDKILEYNPNFKLFLHTKMSNPHYPLRSRLRRRSSTSL